MQKAKTSVLDKVIRVLTTPPFMAATALGMLFALEPGWFGGRLNFVLALVFLVLLPLLAYPLQPVMPGFKGKGRDGQRNLAILMSVAGYVGGILCGFILKVPATLWIIYLTYFVSGLGILLFNKLLHIKASGHACGIAGPLAFLTWFVGPQALWGAVLLLLAGISSVRLGRHTVSQLVWGAVVSVGSFLLSLLALRPVLV